MTDRLLVAVDDSDTAQTALDRAVALAAACDADVHAITVVEPSRSTLTFGVAEVDELNQAARRLVEDARDAYRDHTVEIHAEVRRGQPAETILDYADEIDADAIFVGQRGTSGLSGAVIGSTADRLARTATIPVTIVPGETDDHSD
ncbi:universal stress protein [Halobacteria archaeon AArc-dxtr1]|nr:universal stress protein [Halobacteria archaeon AArc-dxtr1]